MICYKDMTFCEHYRDCAKGETCFRAMTADVVREVQQTKLAICRFTGKPNCFSAKDGHDSR
jgi:hypothetical protein